MKLCELTESIYDFSDYIQAVYNLNMFTINERGNDIALSRITVPRSLRKQGIGTAVMNELTAYADSENKRIILTPGSPGDGDGTTSRARLVEFYKRFGFVENKGRNKDFSISAGMFREPQNSNT